MVQPRICACLAKVGILLAAVLVGSSSMTGLAGPAMAQAVAAPPARDTIIARKTVMDTISANMDEIETMLLPDQKIETAEAREHLDIISVLLQAFPHMFPASTNQWKAGAERDAAVDTFASPDAWAKFDDFYARASAASKAALDASKATKIVEFKAKVTELRAGCDSCHAAYLKPD